MRAAIVVRCAASAMTPAMQDRHQQQADARAWWPGASAREATGRRAQLDGGRHRRGGRRVVVLDRRRRTTASPAASRSSAAAERWSRHERRTSRASRARGRSSPGRGRRTSGPGGRRGARRRSSTAPDVDAGRSSSSGPTLSWQLPNRSTQSTSAWMPSSSSRGSGDHARHQQVGVDERAELGQVDAVAEVGGDGREHVATGERGPRRRRGGTPGWSARRPARRRPTIATAGASSPLSGPTSTPAPPATSIAIASPGGADAGVDDRQHDALGHVRDGPGQGQRTGAHVVGADAVGEVDRR